MTQAKNPLRVVIIGAGLGGLSAAIACRRAQVHTVILEQADQIGSVGAGIQIPPNGARVLDSYGLLPELKKSGVVLEALDIRRYEDGKLLCSRPLDETYRQIIGAPWIVIHREDYHAILLREAMRMGSILTLGATVEDVDINKTEILLENGKRVQADIIIGADGLWSRTRESLYGSPLPPTETGDLAYRGTFSRQQLLELRDPRIEALCEKKSVTVWFGPGRHCVFYPVRSGQEFNLVLIRPDNIPTGFRTVKGDIDEMRATFEGWDEILTKIISCISSVLKWKLCHFDELETWTKNHTALLGDACHPTLPYQAQGAAMAVEDGAVLGYLIGQLSKRFLNTEVTSATNTSNDIQSVLQLYENLRKHRTTLNVQGAIENRTVYHLDDGPDQALRDKALRDADFYNSRSSLKLTDSAYQQDLLGFDALEDAARAFKEWGSSV